MKYETFSNLPEFNMILQSAYLNLFHGATPEIMEAILEAYQDMEDYVGAAAVATAIEQWKSFKGFCRVGNIY